MSRIERSGNGQVLFTLSGRIEGEIQELQKLIASEKSGQQLIFNLRDVTLVNQDAVKFLANCEAHGIPAFDADAIFHLCSPQTAFIGASAVLVRIGGGLFRAGHARAAARSCVNDALRLQLPTWLPQKWQPPR